MANDATEPMMTRRKYGEELRLRREAAGHTQLSLGEAVIVSPSMIAHIEAGRRRPRLEDAKRLDKELNANGFFERWLPTLDEAQFAPHFAEAAESEKLAEVIEEYAIGAVPGLLQTADYARAITLGYEPNIAAKELDQRVVNRTGRARILDNPTKPRMWAILNEAVLRTVVGGPEVMARQLRHIAKLVHAGRVQVQVLPFSSGAHPFMNSKLKLMRFADSPDEAYFEVLYSGALTDEPTIVKRYQDAYDLARAAALPLTASLELIESVAEEYENAMQEHP
ncbi:helix-turn-helix domain-containing protein [Streptomyces millisiae]|uniref:Helix-turn-helix transcriptional regulator n=1 Tax=Streptomyces millisiae TaxID=3075542 RepID=A0ABU2LZ84_9ACTN|nr:helix-turn-helix transcriptional regulator [Streptomyces sp. DSM 44918]MDT0322467.1 helix-turn-helix transcriptional regulator [Streptomyces sp. DSM 44918]